MAVTRKVLYVHHGSGKGGAAVSLLQLLLNLDRNRYEPVVAMDFRRPNAKSFFQGHGFEIVHCRLAPFSHTTKTWKWHSPRGLAKLLQWVLISRRSSESALNKVIGRLRPQIIHLNGLSMLPFARVGTAWCIPVVQHVRESVNDGIFGARKKWLVYLASRHVQEVIYICADNAARFDSDPAHSTVIYNPVDISRYLDLDRDACRRELSIAPNATVLFFPGGSLFEIKGIAPFLQALARLRQTHPCAIALIPGPDAFTNALIDGSGVADAVVRVPFIDRVERYYAASDIVVAPFLRPHFSRAVIEAGAARRPVVGSQIGGITEVLEDGLTGLLAQPGDPLDLADCIAQLLDQPERAKAMAECGFRRAQQLYPAETHARAVMTVYDRLVTR